MKLFVLLTIASIALGQLGAIPLGNNITLYLHDIFIVCLVMYSVWSKKTKLHGTLFIPIVVFVGIGCVSLLLNFYRFSVYELSVSSLYLWRWVLYSALYVISLQNMISSRQWLTWTYWSGVGVAIFGLVQYILYNDLRNLLYLGWDPHYYRVFSTFFDPNYLSLYLVLTMFLGMYFLQGKMRWLYIVGQLVTFAAFLLTYSRSGYVAFLVGLVVYAIYMRKLKIMLIGVSVFFGILLLLPKPYGEGVKLFRTVSTFARVGNWQRGFTLIKEAPIFGFGFNTLRIVQERKGWVDLGSGIPSKAGAGLDDSFQFLWVTTGIIGLLTYIWLLWTMGKLFFRLLGNNATRVLGVIGISALVATIVHSQFINSLFYPQILLWWWILAGASEQTLIRAGTSHVAQSSSGSPRGLWKRRPIGSRRRPRSRDR